MKTARDIKERMKVLEGNIKLAKRKKLRGAESHIRTAIKELRWVLGLEEEVKGG